MRPQAQALLKSLLSNSGRVEELLRFLPSDLAQEISRAENVQTFNPTIAFSPIQWSLPIHYSWFSEAIKGCPKTVQDLFLGTLTPEQAQGILAMLSLHAVVRPASSFLRPFLLDFLRKTIEEPDLLSQEHLPPSLLNPLLYLERKRLIHIVDILGVYDLAADLRQVVDKELLRKIEAALTKEQIHFLHYFSKQPLKWISPKLGLLAWDGTKKQLNHLLHYRGLIRLAKSIVQEDQSFKWHLLHRLDTGRAKIIQKELYQKQDPALIPYFKNQVIHLAKRYSP